MLIKVAASQMSAYCAMMTDTDIEKLRTLVDRIAGMIPSYLEDSVTPEAFQLSVEEALHE